MSEPTRDDVDALVGPATPHFAFQIRARVRELVAQLPDGHEVRRYADGQMERLERLGYAQQLRRGLGGLDAYQTLGVSTSASDSEIAVAYRQLARQFHPDTHPGTSPAERARYEEAMASINAAHDAIKDETSRRSYGSGQPMRSNQPAGRSPRSGECDLCGHTPAEPFMFEYQVAMLFSARRFRMQASLCRQCALAFGRAQQNKTLWSGWWGIISFFTNFGVIFRNAGSLRRAGRLHSPSAVAGVLAPLSTPADPGAPMVKRAGFWFATVLITIVAVVGLSIASNSSSPTSSTPTTFSVGDCISGNPGGTATPVPCSGKHNGKIVDEVSSKNDCNAATSDGYITTATSVFCVDTSQ